MEFALTARSGRLGHPAHSSVSPPLSHRLDWIPLGYGAMTDEFRGRSDHLESLHFAPVSTEISLVLMTSLRDSLVSRRPLRDVPSYPCREIDARIQIV